MSDTGNGASIRFQQIEKRLDLNDTYRHEMRDELVEIRGTQKLTSYQLDELSDDLEEGLKQMNTRFDAIAETSAESVEQRSTRRFQIFLATIAPIIGGAITLLLLGNHP